MQEDNKPITPLHFPGNWICLSSERYLIEDNGIEWYRGQARDVGTGEKFRFNGYVAIGYGSFNRTDDQPLSNELDTALVTEVSLYLTSTWEFYDRCRTLRLNYSKKVAQGKYRPDLAVKGLLPHVTAHLKHPEFKRLYANMKIPLPERIAITKEVLSDWEDEIFAR